LDEHLTKPGFEHHPADEFMVLERSMPGLWKYYHLVLLALRVTVTQPGYGDLMVIKWDLMGFNHYKW